MTTDTLLTLDQFAELPEDNEHRRELLNGRLIEVARPSPTHNDVGGEFWSALKTWVLSNGLDFWVGMNSDFILNDGTRCAPDVYLVRKSAYEQMTLSWGALVGNPELAIEVISKNDLAWDIQEKTQTYLNSGVRSVWHVYPSTREVVIYHSLSDVRHFAPGQIILDPELLPGFELPVDRVFASIMPLK